MRKERGERQSNEGRLEFYLSDPEPTKIRFMICSLYRNRIRKLCSEYGMVEKQWPGEGADDDDTS